MLGAIAYGHFPRVEIHKDKDMKTGIRISTLAAAVVLTFAAAGCASTQTHESTGQYVDDTALTAKVKTAIFNEPALKSSEINVETFKGRVQLSGFVNSQEDITKAVHVAQAVKGVESVKNDMRLK
jgi:osmotically-inducible protein OsmY